MATASDPFGFVFLDLLLGGTNGLVVLEKMKSVSPQTKVIIITGKLVDENLLEEMKAKGADGCLQKPFNLDQVKSILTDVISLDAKKRVKPPKK